MSSSKPAKTYEEQIALLLHRGLVVADVAFAQHCLTHHNYYRISAYRFPLTLPHDPDRFVEGTTFETLWSLYLFDRQLRDLVYEALKLFEISVRARWAYVLGHAHGSQAFENAAVFRDSVRHTDALQKLDEELKRSDEPFVSHYRTKHGMSRPPIWAACEVMSFGLLSRFFANIARDKDRKDIARTYLLFPDNLKSLLEHAVYARNLCAHHARLWNRRFTVTVALPDRQPMTILSSLHRAEDRRLYNTLVLLAHLTRTISPGSDWTARLLALLRQQEFIVTCHMGFPNDWDTRPLWQPLARAEL